MTTDFVVAATRRLPPACEQRLTLEHTFRPGDDDAVYSPALLAEHAKDADALLVTPLEKISADVIAALPPKLKIIATCSAGYEHIDLEAARARGIHVTFAPGVMTDATADIALLLILAASRRATEATQLIRSGSWTGVRLTSMLGCQITGKTLGIVGLGRIGMAVALRAQACGMKILYYNRTALKNPPQSMTAMSSLEELLSRSDVLSLHCPSTPESEKLLNRESIKLLPDGAIIINTARGALIDDYALIESLQSGKIFAAGLDVYANEPALDPRYMTLENVFALPHIGSATLESRTALCMAAIENIDAVLSNRPPINSV